MNTASLELSKELYKLSGWFDTRFKYQNPGGPYEHLTDKGDGTFPAYDLGYLLRKLPALTGRNNNFSLQIFKWENEYHAAYLPFTDDTGLSHLYFEKAETPEDAAAKLTIELLKQGLLK